MFAFVCSQYVHQSNIICFTYPATSPWEGHNIRSMDTIYISIFLKIKSVFF